MFFLTYSQQILHWVLSICAILLTLAIVWFLYYLIQAAKEIKEASGIINARAKKIDKWFRDFKRNFGIGIAAMTIVKDAAHAAQDFFANWKEAKQDTGSNETVEEDKFI